MTTINLIQSYVVIEIFSNFITSSTSVLVIPAAKVGTIVTTNLSVLFASSRSFSVTIKRL